METPRITQARLNQYRQELENSAKDASDFVRSIVEAYQIAYPEASVTDIKKYTCDAIEDALYVFGGQSCTVANELFEELASQAGESADTQIYNTFDRTYAESKVEYFAKDIINGNIATFNGNVGAITGFYVKREAFQNMLQNCRKNGIRYARVPSGRETCAFCFMLASRGFVYHTKQSAGEGFGHSYHRHCDCIIVPGFHEDVADPDAQIAGYKPSKLYERYKSCLDAVQTPQHTWSTDAFNADVRAGKVGADEWEKWKLKRLCAEIDTRDTKWLWTGKPCKYGIMEDATPTDFEKETAQRLCNIGIQTIFKPTRDEEEEKSSDVYNITNGKKTPLEFKSPTGNGNQTIYHQFEEAVGQSKNLVIDLSRSDLDELDSWQKVNKYINWKYKIRTGKNKGEQWEYEEVRLICKDENSYIIKK